ncbi:MAG: phage tail protein, partial [Caldimonas sp.]
MTTVPLFERLPEIYRTRDAEQSPAYPLRAYLGAIEAAFGALHDDIGRLYDDLFIDTCEDWVVPYLADLLGTTHLKGDPRTLRADVADTIALRRRKGTLAAIERLAADLTGWACRAVEMRENLGWRQHLNHPRPDAGGLPPWGSEAVTRFTIPRGGTAPIRDPAALALLGTPFDRFACNADVKPAVDDVRHVNLPNLAVFLWRLVAWPWPAQPPLVKGVSDLGAQPAPRARFVLRLDLHPLDRPVRLFNVGRRGPIGAPTTADVIAPLTTPDAVPGPLLDARITTGASDGHPEACVHVDFFDDGATPITGLDLADVGLNIFLPQSAAAALSGVAWRFRGDNLCAWETGLRRPVAIGEIVIDPDIGRLLIGLDGAAQRDALVTAQGSGFVPRLYVGFTVASPGPVGAHPVGRTPFDRSGVEVREVSAFPGGTSLQLQMDHLDAATQPVVIEIQDSLVHRLDIGALAGTSIDGGVALRLAQSLTIRAADGQRPIVLLERPLGFR